MAKITKTAHLVANQEMPVEFLHAFKTTPSEDYVYEKQKLPIYLENNTIKIADNIDKTEAIIAMINYINTYVGNFEKRNKLDYLKAFNKMYLAIQSIIEDEKIVLDEKTLNKLQNAKIAAEQHIY